MCIRDRHVTGHHAQGREHRRRQECAHNAGLAGAHDDADEDHQRVQVDALANDARHQQVILKLLNQGIDCLLYTSDAADERSSVDLGGRRIIKKKKHVEAAVDVVAARIASDRATGQINRTTY